MERRVTWLILAVVVSVVERCLGAGDMFRPKPVGDGPWVSGTRGAVWPQPQDITTGPDVLQIDPNDFDFEVCLSFPDLLAR